MQYHILCILVLGVSSVRISDPEQCNCEEKVRACMGIPGSNGFAGLRNLELRQLESAVAHLKEQVEALRNTIVKNQNAHSFPNGQSVGEKLYKTDGSQGNFEAADGACYQAGGQLASPMNSAENAAVQQILAHHKKAAYLGMKKLQWYGMFTQLNYTNWANGEPNNAGGKEDCIEMYQDGKWNDKSCTEMRLIVCEFYTARVWEYPV